MLPMSTYVRDIFKARLAKQDSGTWVFPKPYEDEPIEYIRTSIEDVRVKTGIKFCEHDLRRTFETVAESLEISYYSLKQLLNHKTGNDPTAGYIVVTAERLRQSSQRIADHLAQAMGMTAPPATKNVIVIKKKSAM